MCSYCYSVGKQESPSVLDSSTTASCLHGVMVRFVCHLDWAIDSWPNTILGVSVREPWLVHMVLLRCKGVYFPASKAVYTFWRMHNIFMIIFLFPNLSSHWAVYFIWIIFLRKIYLQHYLAAFLLWGKQNSGPRMKAIRWVFVLVTQHLLYLFLVTHHKPKYLFVLGNQDQKDNQYQDQNN